MTRSWDSGTGGARAAGPARRAPDRRNGSAAKSRAFHLAPRHRLPVLAGTVVVAFVGWPILEVDHSVSALVASVPFAAFCVSVAAPLRRKVEASAAAALALLVVAALWQQSAHSTVTVLAPLGALAVIWVGLYGTRRQLWLIVGCAAAMCWGPLLLDHGTRHSLSDWRTATLWVVFVVVVGPVIQSVVQRARLLEPAGARLAGLLRAATEHVIIATDLNGRVTLFNSGAEKVLGWTSAEMLGVSPIEVVFDADEIAVRADALGIEPDFGVLVHSASSGGVDTRDWTLVSKQRKRIVVSLSMTAQRDADNRLVGYIGIATDVTAARRALRDLEAQYQIQQLLLSHLPNTTVGLLDRRLRWVTIGGAVPAAVAGTGENLVGKSIDDTMSAEDAATVSEIYSAAWTEPVHRELRGTDGRTYAVDALPVNGSDRHPLLLTMSRDVTEQHLEAERNRQMSAALAASEQSFRTAFEDAPSGTILTSADPDVEPRFLRVNTAFARLLGRSASELAGRAVDEVTHPDDRDLQLPLPDAGTQVHTVQKRFLHASGQPIWVQVSYSLVRDNDGAPSYYISHVEDINLRKESERSLLAALEHERAATSALQDLDRIRAEVVATISHELRTPLTSIRGYLEILEDGAADDLSPDQLRMVQTASRNAERLAALVDDLLWLARLDAPGDLAPPERRLIDLRDVVRSAVATIEMTASLRNQEVVIDVPDLPVMVNGDGEQLARAMVNLLGNAVKYTEPEGRIEIALHSAAAEAHLDVRDNGIGIPLEEQHNLFDRFFRGAAAHDLAIGGTGLGLAIVKSIVDRHDGSVRVSSSPGHGSRFAITLPVDPAVVPAGARALAGAR